MTRHSCLVCAALVFTLIGTGSPVRAESPSIGQEPPLVPSSVGGRLVALGPGAAGSSQNPINYETAHLDRVIEALRVSDPITIDGRLDEPAWALAAPATDFTQWQPTPGMPASERTEVRFLYDDHNLYIGARCFDSEPHRMTVNELREDFDSQESDLLGIFIDSLRDRQSGYFLSTNPAGARRDTQISNDGTQSNLDWDGVWDVMVTVDEEGWMAEFVIPFKTLRFTQAPSQEFGLNLLRRIKRLNEESHWSPVPRRFRFYRASIAGALTGLEGIQQGRNLKVKPYAISSLTELGTNAGSRDFDGNAGLDIKYGIGSSVVLDLTYRTEFSQVENDQQQVNLTRFSLFLPEKREFFLENAGTFTTAGGGGVRGRAGSGNVIPFFSRRIGLVGGLPIPIVGGARLSGKVGSYDVGMLTMRTESRGDVPANTFSVGRLRKTLHGRSTLGAIVTSRRGETSGDHNELFGVDMFLSFFNRLEVTSYLMQTETPGTSGDNQARLFKAAWQDDDVTVTALHEQVQPNFNPEIGFVQRPDMTHYSGEVSWRPQPETGRIRNYTVDLSTDYYTDPHGNIETRDHAAGAGLLLHNSASFSIRAEQTFERLTEGFEIASDVVITPGDYTFERYEARLNTDRSRALGGSLSYGWGEFWDGTNQSIGGTVEFKPSIHFNMDLNASRNHIVLPAGEFTATLVGTRLLVAFSTKVFLSSFLQYNAAADQFISNTRFNIIHRPMSDLYLVYNERRDTRAGTMLERALIAKLTYLIDF